MFELFFYYRERVLSEFRFVKVIVKRCFEVEEIATGGEKDERLMIPESMKPSTEATHTEQEKIRTSNLSS
jgi:hypothetical protein